MIFATKNAIEDIISGRKTQTRRLVKANELESHFNWDADCVSLNIEGVRHSHKYKWLVGRDYAVQSGRGKPCIWYCPKCKEHQPLSEWHILYGALTKHVISDGEKIVSSVPICPKHIEFVDIKPLRIRITSIRKEKLNSITNEDAKKEGFENKWDFLSCFCEINKQTFRKGLYETAKMKDTEPHWNPDVWVLEFEKA